MEGNKTIGKVKALKGGGAAFRLRTTNSPDQMIFEVGYRVPWTQRSGLPNINQSSKICSIWLPKLHNRTNHQE